METKGIEEMTKDELIELVSSLNKELEGAKVDLGLYKDWEAKERADRILAEKKLSALKAFIAVV